MKVVKKLLAPVLVVGLLLTSLVTLHNLKNTKKDNVFRIGISQYITGPETIHQPIIKPIGSKGLERTEILIPGISDRGPETKHIDQL